MVFRDIIDTVKPGDTVDIGYDPQLGQKHWQDEDKRVVTKINSIDNAGTNIYYGPGNTNDENLLRPVDWCKQTEDTVINQKRVSKARELYEPVIHPTAYMIKSVGIGSTTIFVDTIRPFFNPTNETDGSRTFQDKVTITSQNAKVGSTAIASVNSSGNIDEIIVTNAGVGYTGVPLVTIQSSTGTQATATALVSSGIVTGITVTNSGTEYSSTTPPVILIEPPTLITETNNVSSYHGDNGVIVGFGTTTVGTQNKIIFDFHIPSNSYLRDTSVTGTATTLSGISVGDIFTVFDSNVGIGQTVTTYDNFGNIIGITTVFSDSIFQVDTITNETVTIVGLGTTVVKRVMSNISGISTVNFDSSLGGDTFDSTGFTFDNTAETINYSGIITSGLFFGNYTWGRINLHSRTANNSFDAYGRNGYVGIKTSTVIQRTNRLKFQDYT